MSIKERASTVSGKVVALAGLDDAEVVNLSCSNCGADQTVSASFGEPHCANCGSDNLYTNEAIELTAEQEEEIPMIGYECSKCSSTIHLASAVVASLNNRVCCSNCGTPVQIEEGEEDLEIALDQDQDVKIDELQIDDGINLDDNEVIAAPFDQVEELEDATNQTDEMPFQEVEAGESLVDALDMDDTDKELSFVRLGGRLVAAKAHVTIASLTEDDAGDNAELMGTDAFEQAVRHVTATKGLRQALASFGFRHIKAKVVTKASVNKQVEAATFKLTAASKAAKATYVESLAIASAGIARGLIRKNVALKAAMQTELEALGVRNSKSVVATMFAKHGLEFAKAILSEADRISASSAEYRKDLQQALADDVSPESFEIVDEDEESLDNVQARLAVPALLKPQVVKASHTLQSKRNLFTSY